MNRKEVTVVVGFLVVLVIGFSLFGLYGSNVTGNAFQYQRASSESGSLCTNNLDDDFDGEKDCEDPGCDDSLFCNAGESLSSVSCVDSDGNNLFQKGYTSGYRGEAYKNEDFCVTFQTLAEQVCLGRAYHQNVVSCNNGCLNGYCRKDPVKNY